MAVVHFKLRERTKGGPIATVCKPAWPQPVLRSLLPRRVTCAACLDWIAANHLIAIAQVAALRRAA